MFCEKKEEMEKKKKMNKKKMSTMTVCTLTHAGFENIEMHKATDDVCSMLF